MCLDLERWGELDELRRLTEAERARADVEVRDLLRPSVDAPREEDAARR